MCSSSATLSIENFPSDPVIAVCFFPIVDTVTFAPGTACPAAVRTTPVQVVVAACCALSGTAIAIRLQKTNLSTERSTLLSVRAIKGPLPERDACIENCSINIEILS